MPEIQVTRRQASVTDPDLATAETIEVMCDQVKVASTDSVLLAAAADSVHRFRGGPFYAGCGIDPRTNPAAIAESIWWATKHAIRFEHHEDTIRVWFGERDQLQLLISPELLVRFDRPRGDCAIFTTLECAMLRAWRIPFELVTVAADPWQPRIYGHVYCRAVMPDGTRIPLDASHGAYPGWEVPRAHTIRKQVWDADGEPIADESAKQFSGLHAYLPVAQIGPGFRRGPRPGFGRVRTGLGRFRRGLGQDDSGDLTDILNQLSTPTNTLDTSALESNLPTDIGYVTSSTGGIASTPSTGPGSGTNLAALSSLGSSAMSILSKVIAPTTTITTPYGLNISTPSSSLSALGTALQGTSLTTPIAGAGGLNIITIGLVLLAFVFVSEMASGKH